MLIALILGIIIASMTVGITVLMSQQTKLTNQSSDGRIAYQAALSGIEDGLLRYKYARSKNLLPTLRNTVYGYSANPVQIADPTNGILGSQYRLSFSTGYVGEGAPIAYDAKIDEIIDIDLSSYYRMFRNCTAANVATCKKPTKITITLKNNKFYSDEEKVNGYTMTNFYAPLNVTIDDNSKKGEEQVVYELTNDKPTIKTITIDLKDAKAAKKCTLNNAASTECHLKIKPMIARVDAGSIQNASGNRISGGQTGQVACTATSPSNCTNKFVKLEVESDGYLEGMEPSRPSDFTIISVGRAGTRAYRKLEARIDGQTGNYLGIFDYGIYCGVTCLLGDEPLGS